MPANFLCKAGRDFGKLNKFFAMSKKGLIQKVILKIGDADVVCLIKRNNRARRISVRIISRDEIVLTIPSHESISVLRNRFRKTEMPVNNDLLSFFRKFNNLVRCPTIQIFRILIKISTIILNQIRSY